MATLLKANAETCKKHLISPGDRKYFPNAFKEAFSELLLRSIPGLKKEEVLTEVSSVAKDFSDCLKKKYIDFVIDKNPRVYIELKTVLSNNDFGAALLEGIVMERNEKDIFLIITTSEDVAIRRLAKKKPFKEYINGVYSIDCELNEMLEKIRKLY